MRPAVELVKRWWHNGLAVQLGVTEWDQPWDLTSQIRLGWLESIICVCQVKPGHSLSKDLSSNYTGNHSAKSVDAMCNDAKSPVVQRERSCCGCSTEIKKSVKCLYAKLTAL